ncbi:MAG TPA: hypothetical protein VJ044_12385 [Candidatus Hodarchaeales archaeon]|nr:hypothetical protein [Candidatus Hodarchaeales archaeon]
MKRREITRAIVEENGGLPEDLAEEFQFSEAQINVWLEDPVTKELLARVESRFMLLLSKFTNAETIERQDLLRGQFLENAFFLEIPRGMKPTKQENQR